MNEEMQSEIKAETAYWKGYLTALKENLEQMECGNLNVSKAKIQDAIKVTERILKSFGKLR
jgi:hypothetical protein